MPRFYPCVWIVLAASALASPAPAQPPLGEDPPPPPTREKSAFLRQGLLVAAGGGVVGFTDGDTRDIVDTGGLWEARIAWGTRARVGIEAGYFGSAQSIDLGGLDPDALLLGTGLEANGRFHLLRDADVQPYVLAGLGYTRFDVINEDFNNSAMREDDHVAHVPAGLGVTYRISGAILDIRGLIRAAFDEDLVDEDRFPLETRLDTWSVNARLGWEF